MKNGTLVEGSVLFWDEPEANINPEHLPLIVDMLLELQQNGVQIFISTHDYILAKYFDVKAKDNQPIMFYSHLSGVLKKNTTEDISEELKIYDYSSIKLKFILIIKGHELQWLQPIKDALDKKLIDYNKIWKSEVVINE